ncbi:nitroreductase/quinone reductase family protein [Monashia sp. NPDC004114]
MSDISRSLPPQALINFANPAVRAVLRSPVHGAMDGALLLLHIVGRKTGRRYDIPVGYVDVDGRLLVVTQHAWRANVRGGAEVEVTSRGQRQRMHCTLDEDPRSVAMSIHRVMEVLGPKAAQRLTGLKAREGESPSVGQLEAAVREYGLSALTLTA